jgi:hypothetical protein
MPPISVTAVILRRCARLNGVSRTISTRRRRSFSTTSAARAIRLSDRPCATAASVFIEQGAITMPSVWNEPLAIEAPMSRLLVHHMGERFHVAPLQADFLVQGEGSGVGNDQMRLDAVDARSRSQQTHAVDRAGRAGDGDDDPARVRISHLLDQGLQFAGLVHFVMMSEPPTNSPFTYSCGTVGQFE